MNDLQSNMSLSDSAAPPLFAHCGNQNVIHLGSNKWSHQVLSSERKMTKFWHKEARVTQAWILSN